MSGCQAQLRGLEGSVPLLQSRLLWQYLATPFVYRHTSTHTHMHMLESRKASQKASLEGWNGIGKREKIEAKINVGMRWNEESE